MDIKNISFQGVPDKLKVLTGKVPKRYLILGAAFVAIVAAGITGYFFFLKTPEVVPVPSQSKIPPTAKPVPAPAPAAKPGVTSATSPAPAAKPGMPPAAPGTAPGTATPKPGAPAATTKPGEAKPAPTKPPETKPDAGKQPAPAAIAPQVPQDAGNIISYEYSAYGRRDPFTSLIVKKEPDRKKRFTPIENYDVSEFRLIAILWNRAGYYAVIILPDGKSYTIRENMKLGLHNGRVYKIGRDSVIIKEQIRNERGVMGPKDTILKLRGEEE